MRINATAIFIAIAGIVIMLVLALHFKVDWLISGLVGGGIAFVAIVCAIYRYIHVKYSYTPMYNKLHDPDGPYAELMKAHSEYTDKLRTAIYNNPRF